MSKFLMTQVIMILCSLYFPPQRTDTEIKICAFSVQEKLQKANASFYLIYSFEIMKDGRPTKITKVLDTYDSTDDNEVTSCLREWRLGKIKRGSKVTVSFRWQHGKGWQYALISSANFKQKIWLPEGLGYK